MLRVLLVQDTGDTDDSPVTGAAGFLVRRGHVVVAGRSLAEVRARCVQVGVQWIVCWRQEPGGLVDALLEAHGGWTGMEVSLLVVDGVSGGGLPVGRENGRVVVLKAPVALEEVAVRIERGGGSAPGGRRDASEGVHVVQLAPGVDPVVGSCPAMLEVVEQVKRVAETDSTVLLLGESGTGKELIAQSIHHRSPRAGNPLIAINCGAIPLELLESELFGYERGAFTGARTARKGLLAQADGGTVFLDEVGELPLSLQVKLLRFLQDGEIAPLGGTETARVDVRVISATNRDLQDLIKKRLFREDLYYRLAVIPIRLPPLRERREDIPQLLRYFLARCNERGLTRVEGLTDEAMQALSSYDWPGNVRELRNFVERLTVLADAPVVGLEELPESIRRHFPASAGPGEVRLSAEGVDLTRAVMAYERAMIARALECTSGNQKRAAAMLGLGRTTLIAKAKKLGLL